MALTFEDFEQLKPPSNLDDLGVSPGLVEDIFLRHLCVARRSTIGKIAEQCGLSQAAANKVSESLKGKRMLSYEGADGRDYNISATEAGLSLTSERMKLGRHVGQIPVPIEQYQMLVELQIREAVPDREDVRDALDGLLIDDKLVDQIGTALMGDRAALLYGPPGTGKSVISERLADVYDDVVAIPRYVVADEQIISVYDPALHDAIEDQPEQVDNRFVICRRPMIVTGGELELSHLELRFDKLSGISQAPLQMLANNGILVIDDFGRQAFNPEQLLNRWIMPLTNGVDYLRSQNGGKIAIPFETKLVFSTNIEPHDLGGDAFLRRLRSKIYIGACTRENFDWILESAARDTGLKLTQESRDWIAAICESYLGELRPYIAVDFCEMAKNVAEYHRAENVMTEKLIAQVADTYFVRDTRGELVESEYQANQREIQEPTEPAPQKETVSAGTVERRRPV